MVSRGIDALMKFVDEDMQAQACFGLAFETWCAGICEEFGLSGTPDIEKILGVSQWEMIYNCIASFFLSNTYSDPQGRDWNAVNAFLSSPAGKKLDKAKKHYLASLRDSHMSLYQVVEIIPDFSLTLQDVVEDVSPVTVSEKLGTRCLKRGDIVAAKICEESSGTKVMSGGILSIAPDMEEDIVADIRFLHAGTMELARMAAKKETPAFGSLESAEHLARNMWSTVIGEAYMQRHIRDALLYSAIRKSASGKKGSKKAPAGKKKTATARKLTKKAKEKVH